MRRITPALPFLLLLAGCAESPVAPTAATGQEFQLRPGESVTVEGADLSVGFAAVPSDSRCPADALCVMLGDAEAVFTLAHLSEPAASVTLHTAPDKARRTGIGDWTLTLTRLDPYPHAGATIRPRDYRATLRVDPAHTS
jgi:hypothetical protein